MGLKFIKLNGTRVVGEYQTFVAGSQEVTYNVPIPTRVTGKIPVLNYSNNKFFYTYVPEPLITTKNIKIVPSAITKVQAMKQLKILNKWITFKTVLATNQDAQDEWDLATELQRANPFVAILAPALNMTNAELDTMFINASKL